MRTVIKFYEETSIKTCIVRMEEFLQETKDKNTGVKVKAISHTINQNGFDTLLAIFEIEEFKL